MHCIQLYDVTSKADGKSIFVPVSINNNQALYIVSRMFSPELLVTKILGM